MKKIFMPVTTARGVRTSDREFLMHYYVLYCPVQVGRGLPTG
jgi:hypothetical protein